jgi:EAL domain-containing protein (putative c-di-GMP-specific phosphodiesterase class I)/CheY-like chemotaxis protein
MKSNFNIVNKIKKSVLVVDDEEINREILGAILEEEFDLLFAKNGKEALDILKQTDTIISLILLDLNMPIMNGFEFMKIFNELEEYNTIPILVLTADKDAEVRSLKMGAFDFITKPYVNEVVLARAIKAIELSEDRSIISLTERDPLTLCYTENVFIEYANLLEQYNQKKKMDIVTLNISSFHLLCEVNGKEKGDMVLKTLARLSKEFSRGYDGIVGRGFSDYLNIYMNHLEDYNLLVSFIKNGLDKEFKGLHIRIRYGIYECKMGETMQIRLGRSRHACDLVRNDIDKDYLVFSDKLKDEVIFKEKLIHDFQSAIQNKDFFIMLQPKYKYENNIKTIAGAEALVRWNHKTEGILSPIKFVDLFEKNGLIRDLDYYVWEETIKEIKNIKEEFNKDIPISMNVSRIDLFDPNFIKKISYLKEKYDIDYNLIHLEITESAYTEEEKLMLDKINELKHLGFIIEMDDFGTGYSSLNMLTKIPFDYLKLDRSFINEISNSNKNYKLVELIVRMAHFLNSYVIAEGVETIEQINMLKKLDITLFQGYFFSKPLSVNDFLNELRKENINA